MSSAKGLNIKLRAEFKPLSSAVTLSIELDRYVISMSPRLEVTSHSIQLFTKSWRVVFSVGNLVLKPSSCRNLRWIGSQELQFTLVASWCPEPSNSGDAPASANLNGSSNGEPTSSFQPFNQDHLVERIQKCHPHCYCVGCGAQILNSSCQFKRILPLPSENWSDFADIWFCHNHSNGHENGNNQDHSHHSHGSGCGEDTVPENLKEACSSGLKPRPDDCLVSSLYMMVSARHVNPSAISCSADKLVCKRCGNFLGFVKLGDAKSAGQTLHSYMDDPLNGVYKVYFHTVSFGEEGRNVGPRMLKVPQSVPLKDGLKPREQSVEDFICGLLKDQSRVFTSFRFIIQSSPFKGKGQSGLDILLWLLDQDLYLYSSTFEIDASHSGRSKANSHKSKPVQSSKTTEAQAKPASFVKVQPRKHMKILYKADFSPENGNRQIPPHEVFKDWQKDNTVHGLSLPQPLCQQVLSLLVCSTAQLNTNQRSLNGFNVGYLKSS